MDNETDTVKKFANKFFADNNDMNDLSDERFTELFKSCVRPSIIKPLYDELRLEIWTRGTK